MNNTIAKKKLKVNIIGSSILILIPPLLNVILQACGYFASLFDSVFITTSLIYTVAVIIVMYSINKYLDSSIQDK